MNKKVVWFLDQNKGFGCPQINQRWGKKREELVYIKKFFFTWWVDDICLKGEIMKGKQKRRL